MRQTKFHGIGGAFQNDKSHPLTGTEAHIVNGCVYESGLSVNQNRDIQIGLLINRIRDYIVTY